MPDDYAKNAPLHLLKLRFRKIQYKSNERLMAREYITTFILSLSLVAGEMLTY